jgi:hypothetical protein
MTPNQHYVMEHLGFVPEVWGWESHEWDGISSPATSLCRKPPRPPSSHQPDTRWAGSADPEVEVEASCISYNAKPREALCAAARRSLRGAQPALELVFGCTPWRSVVHTSEPFTGAAGMAVSHPAAREATAYVMSPVVDGCRADPAATGVWSRDGR